MKDKFSSNPENQQTVKLWRCIVCGEIVEGVNPPDQCPACGVGPEQFEEYVEDKATHKSENSIKIVIIGGQIAGLEAAKAARKANPNAEITIIAGEGELPYYRPMLSKAIATDNVNPIINPMEWYEEQKIKIKLGEKAKRIDKENKYIETENEKINYDKLILATGANSFVPPIEGADQDHVFTLRTLEDVRTIKAFIKDKKNAVVVGGGILGLESAWQLNQLGLDVKVIEMAPRILPRQLDKESSEILGDIIKSKNIEVLLDDGCKKILQDAVLTSKGSVLKADIVLISAGVRANVQLAKEIDLEINRGIVVNKFLQTSNEDIYAAGDCAEYDQKNFCLWPEAMAQGAVAGANACGLSQEYETISPLTFFHGMDTEVFSTGAVPFDNLDEYELVSSKNLKKQEFKKLIFKDKTLVGGILIGDPSKSKIIIKSIASKKTLNEIINDIFE